MLKKFEKCLKAYTLKMLPCEKFKYKYLMKISSIYSYNNKNTIDFPKIGLP